ncbi:UDP-N-acetylmuramoyl-tripeptide--D-alanyl-D-alanine ligase [Desulfobacterales bacterium HSG16]|nr:UDP-N-acetylmuramoyl-tripeptide--D-alanyl-D-alanine ligase [Desulfobacterales bacterium HSG16]
MKSNSWNEKQILEATGGQVVAGRAADGYSGISIDSRTITETEIFMAIPGENFDGHDFVTKVMDKKVSGLIIEKRYKDKFMAEWNKDYKNKDYKNKVWCVAVDDTINALGSLACYHRKRSKALVLAITGSNGKTTTRTMTAAVMAEKFKILTPTGNFNNEIGLPLTLFNLDSSHEWAVMELGMNHAGEIARLTKICLPDMAMITNIGPAHLEGVGSIEGVMSAKAELLEHMPAGAGTVILNGDDHRVKKLADRKYSGLTGRNILFFGTSENAHVRASDIEHGRDCVCFLLNLPSGKIKIRIPVPAPFLVSNALAASAAGFSLGISKEAIKSALESFTPVTGRMNITKTGDYNIIDDTYNANPGSMKAAIDTLLRLKGDGRGFFVVGDMFELGDHAAKLHEEIGAYAAASGVDRIFATGDFADNVASGATGQGMDVKKIFTGSKPDIVKHLCDKRNLKDWILVKGSRSMKMEEVVNGLKASFTDKP